MKKFELDILGLTALILTFISILFSFNLSIQEITLTIGIFLIIIATYIYIIIIGKLNQHEEKINKINENINIHKELSSIKLKIDFLMNEKMKKRGQIQIAEILIRIIQVGAIIFAIYIILKSLGLIKF